ncbi:MAG: putative sulfate exporter family transporter [Pyrinomonadaceae bacterium]|nr:putative sulfate exporter family transporter [Pyrinomonadaceae bacterium]MBP6213664.1 putative sulfate exporter family transporter [Pyrinomonadaceae bacterium]
MTWQKAVFIVLILFCLSPYGSPPVALALGLAMASTFGTPYPKLGGKPMKYLLQASVVLLGFGMNFGAVLKAGRDGVLFTIATIFGTLIVGYFVGRALNVPSKTSSLISSGTAICGGSAIAAVAPAINAESDEISVSLGTVFVLNSIALFLFPIIGHGLDLTQLQFGVWSAIAIHDTSSVVGASSTYGPEALAIATTVKLARALWIAPLALMFAYIYRDKTGTAKAKIAVPWFIFLFVGATIVRSYAPVTVMIPSVFDALVNLAKAGMTVTLFLIGASLSRETLRNVGIRPLLQGVLLWIAISVVALVAVLRIL